MTLAPLILMAAFGSQPFWLDEGDLSLVRQGWGKAIANKDFRGGPLTVNETTFERGVATLAPSIICIDLDGKAATISGSVGIQAAANDKGSAAFFAYTDGKLIWSSPRMKKKTPALEFACSLNGARKLILAASDGGNGSESDFADWLNVKIEYTGQAPKMTQYTPKNTIDLTQTRQTIDNFGASDCWSTEPLAKWSQKTRNKIADLLFSTDKGIGLSCWRFNVGGGINHETITNPLRTVASFETSPGKYDWNAVPGQVWMLKAAHERGVPDLLAFANTPPKSLTRNGFTNCTAGKDSTNLKPGAEGAFAKYLCDIVEHFQKEGIKFKFISPINEPDVDWNGVPNPGSQEGSRASNDDILRVCDALAKELATRKMDQRIVTPETNTPWAGARGVDWLTLLIGSKYGDYTELFHSNPGWLKLVNPVYAYHGYAGDSLESMVTCRQDLRKALGKIPGVPVWHTEYCQMSGPRGEGGHGRDLGMNTALNIARLIHLDLTIVEASAWQWWLGLSDGDYKDGLLFVDGFDNNGDESVYTSKLFWIMGNYSRFVRPGMVRVNVETLELSIEGTHLSAYLNKQTGRVVVVALNHTRKTETVPLDIRGGSVKGYTLTSYITSDRPGDDLRKSSTGAFKGSVILPSKSVVTYVLDPK